MRRRSWINLFLLLLVAGLGAVAYFEPGRTPEPQPAMLTGLDADSVHDIEIQRRGKDTLRLHREDGRWLITEPFGQPVPANALRIKSLLAITETASQSQFAVGDHDLSQFRLDDPEVIVTLNDVTVAFGGTDALNGWRYVRAGDTVHLIVDTAYWFLSADTPTFVAARLLPEDAKLLRLELPGLTLTKKESRWTIEPAQAQVSADAVQALLSAWGNAQALAVEGVGEDIRGEEISVTLAQPARTLRFVISAREPELTLARPEIGLRYRLPASSGAQLLALQSESDTPSPSAAVPH